jgi:hypothetical protein
VLAFFARLDKAGDGYAPCRVAQHRMGDPGRVQRCAGEADGKRGESRRQRKAEAAPACHDCDRHAKGRQRRSRSAEK